MRKLLSLVLAFAMILGLFAFPVSADATTYQQVGQELVGLGVLKGVDEKGTLAEMQNLTREQALVVLTRLMGQEDKALATDAQPGFTDVPAAHWYSPYVAYAKLQGWTNGVSETEFGLGQSVTTKQVVTLMMRALGYEADWSKEDVMKKAQELGLMEGVAATADDAIIRGELFIVMKNTLYTKPMGEKAELIYKLGLAENPVPATLEVVDVKATNLMEIIVEFNQEVDKDTLENAFSSVGLNLANVEANLLEDGKTVVLSLTQEMKNKQEYKITISKVKSLSGVMMEKVLKEFKTEDNETPKVEKLVVTGPKTFDIHFSEPIKKAGSVKMKVEKKNGPGASVTARGEKVFEVKTGSEMKDGTTYTVLISGFSDYANYNMIADERELEYAKVTTAPTVEVVKATQEYVVVKFDRPVKGLTRENFFHTYTAWKPVNSYKSVKAMNKALADKKDGAKLVGNIESRDSHGTVVVRFLGTVSDFIKKTNEDWHPLQVGDVEFTVLGQVGSRKVVDNWGNQLQDTEIVVNITADKTAPVIESVEAVGEKEIEITFSKEVIYDKANYEILAGDGSKFKGSFRSSSKEGKKVKLVLEGDSLVGKSVILNVKNVRDNTINMNKLVGTESFNVTFGDKTFEGIKEVYLQKKDSEKVAKLFVVYKEAMDPETATNIKNYRITENWKNPELGQKEISGDTSMFSDSIVQITISEKEYKDKFEGKLSGKKLELPADDAQKGMKIVVSRNVKDLAGNDNAGFTVSEFILTKSTAPKLVSKDDVQTKDAVVATGKTEIKMNFDQPLQVYGTSTIDPTNFEISLNNGTNYDALTNAKGDKIFSVDSAEFSADDKKQITLTLRNAYELPTDLKNVAVKYTRPSAGDAKKDGEIVNELEISLETVETKWTNMTDKISPEYEVVQGKDKSEEFKKALYSFDGTDHKIALYLSEEVKPAHINNDTFKVTGSDSERYGIKSVDDLSVPGVVTITFNVKDSQVESLKERLEASLKADQDSIVTDTDTYFTYFVVEVQDGHRVLDMNNNELSKEAVKVYHTKADTDLFLDKDIAKLTKLVAEVEAFIASLKKEATPPGTAEYGKVYMDVAGADKDVYEALDKADTGALQLAKKALKDHDKLEESTTKLQEKFDAAKAEADFIAPELKDTVTFKRSQVTVDATNVKVENLATGEKVFFHEDNSAINVMLGDAPGAEAVNGEFKATEDHFVIVKVDKDGKVVSFKRYTKAADLVNKVGKKAEATTLTLKDATNNSLTVGNKDLKTETIVNATGYVLDTTDQVQFEVDPGTATVKYMTEVVSGDVLKNAEFAAPEAKELVSKDNVKLMATGVFKMTITVTQEDADNGNYIPTEYVVTVTVQP